MQPNFTFSPSRSRKKNVKPKEKEIKAVEEPTKKNVKQNKLLPKAIIVDLDGTLALNMHRDPFDFSEALLDQKNVPVAMLVELYREKGYKVLLVTGRDAVARPVSLQWLKENNIAIDAFYGRPEGNFEKADIIKERMLYSIVQKYYVELVIEDRTKLIEMYRDKGIQCIQVHYPQY